MALAAGRKRQCGSEEAPAADPEPAAAQLQPPGVGQLKALQLEVNTGGRRGGRPEHLSHVASDTPLGRNLALGGAAPDAGRAGLLPSSGVAMDRPSLDGLVDRLHQHPVLRVGHAGIAPRDGILQPAEVRLYAGGVTAVLEPLAGGSLDPLLL